MDMALLIARLVVGLGIAAHGAQKLFGWFDGHGIRGTGEGFAALGFRAPKASAFVAGLGESGSGLLIATGFLGPIGPALMIAVMVVAAVGVHLRSGFFAMKNGMELPLLYAVAGLLFVFTDFGNFALDSVIAAPFAWTTSSRWMAAGTAALIGIVIASLRRTPAMPASPTS